MAAELQRLQSEIETQVNDYNQLDKKAQQLAQTRNSLHEQESENALVLKEMEMLPPDVKILKQVGGVLIEQNAKEARTTLSNRVALINNQIDRTNDLIKDTEKEQHKLAQKVQKAKQFYYEMAQKLQQQ